MKKDMKMDWLTRDLSRKYLVCSHKVRGGHALTHRDGAYYLGVGVRGACCEPREGEGRCSSRLVMYYLL